MKKFCRLPLVTLAGAAALSLATTAALAGQNGGKPGDAKSFLELKKQPDNHCMLRDPRGKLVVLINQHPSKAIGYRIVRLFAGHVQPGLTVGVIAANSDPVALGCSIIDNREQRWEVRSAHFAPAPQSTTESTSDKQGGEE